MNRHLNRSSDHAVRRPVGIQAEIDNQRGALLDTGELALYYAVERGEGWAIVHSR
jgi:hypothetical protein